MDSDHLATRQQVTHLQVIDFTNSHNLKLVCWSVPQANSLLSRQVLFRFCWKQLCVDEAAIVGAQYFHQSLGNRQEKQQLKVLKNRTHTNGRAQVP